MWGFTLKLGPIGIGVAVARISKLQQEADSTMASRRRRPPSPQGKVSTASR